jgi:hypothetical protein
LKTVLDELSSAEAIISILQDELLTFKASTPTCGAISPTTTEPHQKPNTSKWTEIAHKRKSGTRQKQVNHISDEVASPGNSFQSFQSENRFSVLYNLKKNESAKPRRANGYSERQANVNRIPTLVNGNYDYQMDFPSLPRRPEYLQAQTMTPQTVNSSGKEKHKVLIVGDSHAKNCASLLQDNLGPDFAVTGFVKSGASIKQILTSAEDLLNSHNDDFVVIWGGAHDISKNYTREVVKSVYNFVESNKNTNVILISSPHRFDLPLESCVNTEVANFNKLVKKITEHQPQVEILELTLNRAHFTTHGLHLNSRGKSAVLLRKHKV